MKSLKKSDWLPALIFMYFIAMTVIFGKDYIRSGRYVEFGLTVGAELVVLILLRIFLKKRESIGK